MADEKELNLKGIDTAAPEGNGEPDKNPIIESSKDEIKSSDAFITPENARDQNLAGLTAATLSSTKSPVILGSDFTFDKRVSDQIDRLYLPVDLAKAIPDPNERKKFIKNREEYEEELGRKSEVSLLDPNIFGVTFEDEVKDLYNFRQQNYITQVKKLVDDLDENQGFWNALGQFGGNFLGQTAVAVSSIIPLVYGVGKAIVNWDANEIFNNTLFDKWDQAAQATREQFVVYGGWDYTQPTASGEQKGIRARMTDNFMKSMNDDIAPAMSFIAGAIITEVAAGMLAPVTGGTSLMANTSRLAAQGTRFFSKAMRVSRGLDNVSDAVKMRQLAVLTSKYRTGLGTLTTMVRTAGYESSLIARDTYQSTRNKSIMNYINSDIGMKRGLKEKYENILHAHTDEFGNLSITQEEALALLEKDIPQKDRIRIENNAKNAGELAWFSNVPLVGFSNMMQFPRIFNSSYRLGQRLIPRAVSKINPLTGTKMVGGKMVSRAADRRLLTKALGYTMPIAKRTLGEGFEEFTQGVFEEGYSNYYSAAFSQPAEDFAIPFFSTMTGTAKKYFKSVEGQDSMLIGGLMGLVGIGLPGIKTKASGKKGLTFQWYGGFPESIREVNQKIKQAQQQSDIYNGKSTNEVLKFNLENTLRGVTIQADMDKALAEGDIFNFKNQEANNLFSFVQTRVSSGIGDTIMQDLDALEKMDLKEFNEIYAFKDQEFQYNETQKEKIINTAKENVTDAIEAIAEKDALIADNRVFIDKAFNPEFLGANTYRSFLGFSVKGNIDSKVDEFVEEEFADRTEEQRYNLKESFKHELRNQLAYLTYSEKNLTRREKQLTEQLREILPDGGLSSLLNDNNYERFVVGTKQTTIKDNEGNDIDVTDIKFENPKARLKFAVSQILADIKEKNPNAYNFNENKIKELVTDIFKIKDKKAKGAAFYNTLFTEKGARQFIGLLQSYKQDLADRIAKVAEEEIKQRAEKANGTGVVSDAQNQAKDLDTSSPGRGEGIRDNISKKQEKEINKISNQLDAILEAENLNDYSEINVDSLIELLEDKPALFEIVKTRLKEQVPGLDDVDVIPSLSDTYNELNSDLSLEQLIAETVYDIINDQKTSFPAEGPIDTNYTSGAEGVQPKTNKAFEDILSENFENYEEKGVATSDNFVMLITHDKDFRGKQKGAQRSNGKLVQRETDQPIEKSLKDINSATVLNDDFIIKNNPQAYFKYAENKYGKEEAGIENRAIEVYFKDSKNKEIFLGTIPSLIDEETGKLKPNISPKLRQLRSDLFNNATINPETGILEIDQETVTYEGYEATVAPKTETKKTTTSDIEARKKKLGINKNVLRIASVGTTGSMSTKVRIQTPDGGILIIKPGTDSDLNFERFAPKGMYARKNNDPYDVVTLQDNFDKINEKENLIPQKLVDILIKEADFKGKKQTLENPQYTDIQKKIFAISEKANITSTPDRGPTKEYRKEILDPLSEFTDLFLKEIYESEIEKHKGYIADIKKKGDELGKKQISTREEYIAVYENELAALEQTTSPETEVEQSAREKIIENNFQEIIKQLENNQIIDGENFIGQKRDC